MQGDRERLGPFRPPSLQGGDAVRLKFLYPGGAVEILDCVWIAIVGLGANGSEALSQWVVVDFEGRELWKPLGYLVQAEVLEVSRGPPTRRDRDLSSPTGDLGYHR